MTGKEENLYRISRLGARTGEILLRCGAETYRAEETVERACRAAGAKGVNVYVTPTGLFLSVDGDGSPAAVEIRRVRRRDVDLDKVSRINALVRTWEREGIEPGLGEAMLADVASAKPVYGFLPPVLMVGLASAAAVFFLGGSPADALPAGLGAVLVRLVMLRLPFLGGTYLLGDFLGAFLTEQAAQEMVRVGLGQHVSAILVAALLNLVPGAMIVGSVRDFIAGDLVSGVTRGAESLLVAVALAAGVAAAASLKW